LQKQALSRIEEMIRVNISASVALTRLFIPGMLGRGNGTIVNITSISAWERSPYWSVYGATKAFLQSFTESLQDELKDSSVYVTAVCPGLTRTSFFDSAGVECPENVQDPQEVVAEALAGIDRRLPLIVTGRSNRIRIHAQRANLRTLLANIRGGLRKVGVLS
jgi:short-subunit dehydrogenase